MSQNPALNWSFIMLLTSEVVIESFTESANVRGKDHVKMKEKRKERQK
jgi:hypothetical protein